MKICLLVMALCAVLPPGALAQSFCASDGQPIPTALVERFISADCEACWRAPPSGLPEAQALTLDWVVPGEQGAEAPLSAVAHRDALQRLATLGHTPPKTAQTRRTPVDPQPGVSLRVAHGVALGGYIGASMAFKTAVRLRHPERLSAWLVLIETVPAGTEGTPVARHLVRNVFQPAPLQPAQPSAAAGFLFKEMRPLSIPEGAVPERLRVVGWVQDSNGHVLAAARSVCGPPAPSLVP